MSTLISLALPIKNGLPGLTRTLAALERQTYRNFELIVQDGGSTDGSLDLVRAATLPHVDIVQAPDNGISQAYNRAFKRCRGPLVAAVACDEYYEDNALATFARWFDEHPYAAFCYGGSRLWKTTDEIHSVARSGKWDFLKFLQSEYVPPAGAGCYNKEIIGSDFYCDETLQSVPDFDLFLRLGLRFGRLEIVEKDDVVQNSMRNATSYICRPENYDQVLQDLAYILNRFFVAQGNSRLNQHLHRLALAGAYCTYASHVLEFDGETPQLYRYVMEAAKYDPGSERVAALVARLRGLDQDPMTGQVFTRARVQPEAPPDTAEPLPDAIDLSAARSDELWPDARTTRVDDATIRVTTGAAPWSYASIVPTHLPAPEESGDWCWIEASVRVVSGQAGFGVLSGQALKGERLLARAEAPVALAFPVAADDMGLLVRNGSLAEPTTVELFDVRVVRAAGAASLAAAAASGESGSGSQGP